VAGAFSGLQRQGGGAAQQHPGDAYDDVLPIAAKRDEIKAALEKSQVVVIAGVPVHPAHYSSQL